ncbi:hypothetical protein ACIBI3_00230 [Actinomadura luteofluorescens]|uniref:hypothetical protein n=1 Tax=Actinomadura luteofluorescens TaxID=46163 RepID=UPI00346F354B
MNVLVLGAHRERFYDAASLFGPKQDPCVSGLKKLDRALPNAAVEADDQHLRHAWFTVKEVAVPVSAALDLLRLTHARRARLERCGLSGRARRRGSGS